MGSTVHQWVTERYTLMNEHQKEKHQKEKDVLFIIGDWNAQLGSQEIPGITGNFGLGVQNEAGPRLKEFCQENALVIANTLF